MTVRWHNFKSWWVCCIMPFVLHHFWHIFFPRKENNKQVKQLKSCCKYIYNAERIIYHGLILVLNDFCFSRHSKICYKWITLSGITFDTSSHKLASRHSELFKVLNSSCFLHQKHDIRLVIFNSLQVTYTVKWGTSCWMSYIIVSDVAQDKVIFFS